MLLLGLLAVPAFAAPSTLAHWAFDSLAELHVQGEASLANGVEGKAVVLDGESLLVAKDSAPLTESAGGFAFTVWVNPYALNRGQQMILAKNRYSLGERQWGLMIDQDNRFRLYAQQRGWVTVDSKVQPVPGHWYQLGVVVRSNQAELYVNGQPAGSVPLSQRLPQTQAPLTIGGVDDNGRLRQMFLGAIDEVRIYGEALAPEALAAQYRPVSRQHEIPRPAGRGFPLWDDGRPVPRVAEVEPLAGVAFHVIKPRVPEQDGYNWLHGVALAWHQGKLYASFGHNRGSENTATEEARGRVSADAGHTWGDVFTIDAGDEPELAISHGVFLSRGDQLWAFHGAFYGRMKDVHARAYRFDESTGTWRKQGVVVKDGFWPLQEPLKMADGNWIMSGVRVANGYGGTDDPAAVAISHGDDLTRWDLVIIPKPPQYVMWGESAVIVDGRRVINVARFGARAQALVAVSEDYGRTWTESRPGNLPMATSKPYAGTLSTGQRYLVCTTTADSGGRRAPLTIAVSRPGENLFRRVFRIRDAVRSGPGESHPKAALSYPYAVEHAGKLYVGYSNSGGRGGNQNSAELAVIPIASLVVRSE